MTNIIPKIIAIGCDHAALELKKAITDELTQLGVRFIDFGTYSHDSVDYPDYAHKVSEYIIQGKADMGILLCGTGIGISIAANRNPKIRCALCHDEFTAQATRAHNNANILAMGARVVDNKTAIACLRTFITTEFEGGRHQKRIDKMSYSRF